MSDLEALARRFIGAWNVGGEHIVDELADPNLIVTYTHFPEPLRGREAFKQALRETHAFFPDLAIDAEEVLATVNGAVVRWAYTGTHQQGDLFGVRPEGTRVTVSGITVYRIRNGRITEEIGVVDNLGLMSQLQRQASPPA